MSMATEAFSGNVILKLYEGVGAVLISKVKEGLMSTLRSKIGALLIKPALKTTLKSFDASEYGGAPLLGLRSGRKDTWKFESKRSQQYTDPMCDI